MSLYEKKYTGNIIFFRQIKGEKVYVDKVQWVCKGNCDESSERKRTRWKDISDLVIPGIFLVWLLDEMNDIRTGQKIYSEQAFSQLSYFIQAIAQKVFRDMTAQERDRLLFELNTP